MKDEFGGIIVSEFVEIKFRQKKKKIQSKKRKLGTYEIDKISLSCFHDKRYMLDDGVHTFSYFHKDSGTSC